MIIFKTLTFKNFLSVGNRAVSLDLHSHGTTLIHGTNGSGKSTILDALTYSLFNKPFRKVNLPQLMNTQNGKGLEVEVEFSIGRTEFKVRRGMKPKLLEIYKDGELLENKAADKDMQAFLEQQILKLTYKSFTQIVILGSSNFIPFMQLPSAGRRDCVEDFLDIKVFSTMSIIAKERLRSLKDSANTIKGDIGNLEFKIDVQEQRVKELEQQSEANIEELNSKIKEAEAVIETLDADLKVRRIEEGALKTEAENLLKQNPTKKSKELNAVIIKLTNKIERLNKNVAFYKDNDTCHACKQEILPTTKEKYIGESEGNIAQFSKAVEEATELMGRSDQLVAEAKEINNRLSDISNIVFQLEHKRNHRTAEIKDCNTKLTELELSTGSVERERGKLDILNEELDTLKQRYYAQLSEVDNHEAVVSLLKDSGIKTTIVKKYLPVMNKYIRKYLTDLDLPLHFVLDEQFNESVSSPLHQNFSYGSFSEGQKARIDLALMLTWREVCRLKSSVSTNVLFLDEVFSGSLDETGKELLLAILRYQLEDTNVVVVDHTLSGTFKDKFERSIEVRRTAGFSHYDHN